MVASAAEQSPEYSASGALPYAMGYRAMGSIAIGMDLKIALCV